METLNDDSKDIKKQYDLVYENVSKKLDEQIESLGLLDTKASIFLAVIGILFAGYLQLLSSQGFDFEEYKILVILEIVSFLFTGFYTFRALVLKKSEVWRSDPRPKKLINTFTKNFKKGEYWLKDQMIKSISEAYEKNDVLIIKKYNNFFVAKNILYFGIVLFVFHLVFVLFGIDKIIINLVC